MKHILQLALISTLVFVAAMSSEARTLRATELNGLNWQGLSAADVKDLVVEFREGDRIPIHLSATGDFFEADSNAMNLQIKKSFFVKFDSQELWISFDGQNYRPLKEMMSGTISLGADQEGGIADAINVALSAVMKKH